MNANPEPLSETIALLLKEGKRRLLPLTMLFAVVALIALPVGLSLPKRWDASTLILAENSNIIQPLMQGRAVSTDVSDQVAILNQIMARRRIMREVATFGGWLDGHQSPVEEERVINKVKARIKVDSPRPEMVRISYFDTDPVKAARVANKLAEIYVREGTLAKERESKEAFDFIDKRVTEYAVKLTEAHQNVITRYRDQQGPNGAATAGAAAVPAAGGSARPVARVGGAAAPAGGAAAPPAARLPPPISPESRQQEEDLSRRVSSLQNDLNRLLGNYTEQHPDVVRVRRDLNNAQAELKKLADARVARERAAVEAAAALDESVIQAARASVQRGAAPARPGAATPAPAAVPAGALPPAIPGMPPGLPGSPYAQQIDPAVRVATQDATLQELLNRYEATRDVYQDLLKRRENARVSMDLDAERRGLSLRVQEPAEIPATASSLRLMHLSAIGLAVAAAIPLGLLFALVKVDGRVRSDRQIERLKVPLLTTIPHAAPPTQAAKHRLRGLWAVLMVVGVFAVYLAVFLVKLKMTST
ncbi:MAG: hypothetical protein ACOY0T_17585 [Myxococcota bacterium]